MTQSMDPARSAARLAVVARLARSLNSAVGGTTEPLYAILDAVLRETVGRRAFIMLYDEGRLRFAVGLAADGRVLGAGEFACSTTLVERALHGGRAVVVPDLLDEIPYTAATSARELGIRSAVCVPLHVGKRRGGSLADPGVLPSVRGIAGVLYVDSSQPGSMGPADAGYFELLADCSTLAVRAARDGPSAGGTRESPRAATPPALLPETPEPLAHPYEEFVTRGPGLRDALRLLDRVVATDANVLVRGESGTGKELVARALHRESLRSVGPFVAIDCGAVPEELVASELFGHEANAFSGASEARAGLLERADGGVLFLDEVGAMSPAMQGALLRALQEGEARRLGGDQARSFDVRVVATTHHDLRVLVERGSFRHDLFFRLAVVEILLPPLRERRGDVSRLVEHFTRRIAARTGRAVSVEPDALRRLEEHGWPGNVRELENLVESLAITTRGRIGLVQVDAALESSPLRPPELPGPRLPVRVERGVAGTTMLPASGTLEDLERRAVIERLEQFGWNQARAAESLGVDRRTLHRKIRAWGITPP